MAVRLFEGEDHAAAYLQYRVAPQELIGIVMSYMQEKSPGRTELALDVGCGSGQGTVLLAPFFSRVVGTDVSPAQLKMALHNGGPANVSYRECPAEELPFSSGEVDLVAAVAAAHWFDRARFLREADRVLRPRGCLALLSYTMDMELEYGDVSQTLNDVCREFYRVLHAFRDPHLGSDSVKIYSDLFESCSYPDKEWNDCFRVRRTVPLSRYVGMVETFSTYQTLRRTDPEGARRFSRDFRTRLLAAMKATSLDTEVTMIVKYFYVLACKPQST